MTPFKFRVGLCWIRLFPTLISKIKRIGSEIPLRYHKRPREKMFVLDNISHFYYSMSLLLILARFTRFSICLNIHWMSWTLLKTAEKSEDEDSDFYVISDESFDEDDNRLRQEYRTNRPKLCSRQELLFPGDSIRTVFVCQKVIWSHFCRFLPIISFFRC